MAAAHLSALLAILLITGLPTFSTAEQVHIVYMGGTQSLLPEDLISNHHYLLSNAVGSTETAKERIIYSYKHSFNGFAAILSTEEAAIISKMPGVVSVFPSLQRSLHTTRSWEFLGLKQSSLGSSAFQNHANIWQQAKYGQDVIIGILDTGIWPESASFRDDMFTPIPSRWKGSCESGTQFNASNCNKKLIGARMYIKGYERYYGKLNLTQTGEFLSARDKDGHGTHTSSTAGGNFVPGANIFGFANGTATGGAPLARIAMYKVCWPMPGGSAGGEDTCFDEDMLAGLDQGIEDGVDIFSISIGSGNPQPAYLNDAISVGSYHAIQHNILVACSAGNSGPSPATTANLAPWILTVAASSLDRDFPSNIALGNGTILQGKSIAPEALPQDQWYEFIDAGTAAVDGMPAANASQCLPNTLDKRKVKGKILLCLRGQGTRVGKSQEAFRAGAAGFILGNSPSQANEVSVDAYQLPGTAINADNAVIALEYLNSTSSPLAKIVPAKTVLDFKPAPTMAAFSSQGPNTLTPDIIKPDISAPGLNILAAWTGANSPTKQPGDDRTVGYNIISGTSMSCPHVAGVAALLKAIYPTWSPAAIKSALMTTASVLNNNQQPILNGSGVAATPFNYGSGEVNPDAAADPGLVYDTSTVEYLGFLCQAGTNISLIQNRTGNANFSCSSNSIKSISDLNYPSIAVTNLTGTRVITRTVTNVGSQDKAAVYSSSIESPPGVLVSIEPSTLTFEKVGDKKTFLVTLKLQQNVSSGNYVFGSYHWSDGVHIVRSPIVVLPA